MSDGIEKAAQAHSDLCVFASIIAILESGNVYGSKSQAAAEKII
jgi:hypothetical protein